MNFLPSCEPASIPWTPNLVGMLASGALHSLLRHPSGTRGHNARHHEEATAQDAFGGEASASVVRQPEGNGCVERFIRTLKEQPLWRHRFRTVKERNWALRDFARRFNNHWIIGRIGFRTPAAHRRILLGEAA
jgi:hypothetical protein